MLLARILGVLVRRGRLVVIDADGRRHDFGEPSAHPVTVRLHDRRLHHRFALNPRLAMGEAYMDGSMTVEEGGSIYDFLVVMMDNVMATPHGGFIGVIAHGADRWAKRVQQYNPLVRARRNVAHHYDLADELYASFLDADRQYSCAYFEHPDDDLETAQAAKKQHIAAKLVLRPGLRVLDIGSGWGGLGLYLAREGGADVTGLTLSTEQHAYSTARALREGLARNVRFELRDYRDEQGSYDRIVSVGMFEHVGVNHYREFFDKVAMLLAHDGVALLHAIGRGTPGTTNPWLRKYIFPGGYSPALSEVLPPLEAAGLRVTDIEILRLHYAETLRAWRERFVANRARIAARYDDRFCRMWEFYLAGCEAGFRVQDLMVFQIQMSKSVNAVPITRDYIDAWKGAHPLHAESTRLSDVAD